jgi:hypothetical protein
MKIALYGLACYLIGVFLGGYWTTKENDFAVVQYNQMIRTCEASQEGRECVLVAVPRISR